MTLAHTLRYRDGKVDREQWGDDVFSAGEYAVALADALDAALSRERRLREALRELQIVEWRRGNFVCRQCCSHGGAGGAQWERGQPEHHNPVDGAACLCQLETEK